MRKSPRGPRARSATRPGRKGDPGGPAPRPLACVVASSRSRSSRSVSSVTARRAAVAPARCHPRVKHDTATGRKRGDGGTRRPGTHAGTQHRKCSADAALPSATWSARQMLLGLTIRMLAAALEGGGGVLWRVCGEQFCRIKTSRARSRGNSAKAASCSACYPAGSVRATATVPASPSRPAT